MALRRSDRTLVFGPPVADSHPQTDLNREITAYRSPSIRHCSIIAYEPGGHPAPRRMADCVSDRIQVSAIRNKRCPKYAGGPAPRSSECHSDGAGATELTPDLRGGDGGVSKISRQNSSAPEMANRVRRSREPPPRCVQPARMPQLEKYLAKFVRNRGQGRPKYTRNQRHCGAARTGLSGKFQRPRGREQSRGDYPFQPKIRVDVNKSQFSTTLRHRTRATTDRRAGSQS